LAPTTTTATSTPSPSDATTSANLKPSATRSPSNPQPERPSTPRDLPGYVHFRISCRLAHLSEAGWPPSRAGIAPPRSRPARPVRKAQAP
jgi:hypothetical protein